MVFAEVLIDERDNEEIYMLDDIDAQIEKFKKALAPDLLAQLQEHQREITTEWVKAALRQTYKAHPAEFSVARIGSTVTIEWQFSNNLVVPGDYFVFGQYLDMPHLTCPELSHTKIHYGYGDGSVRLELAEGHVYFFIFVIKKAKDTDTRIPKIIIPGTEVLFSVGIPLSDESHRILEEANLLKSDPSAQFRAEAKQSEELENTYDELLNARIEKIKAMKLSETEKEERIERVREDFIRLKEKWDMEDR